MSDITAWLNLRMKFAIAHFPVTSRCKCSDISSHIVIRIAIIGRLRTVFISGLKNSFSITLSAVLQSFTFSIPLCQIHQYGKRSVEMLICYWNKVRDTLGKRTKNTRDFNYQSRKYNFLLFPIISVRQKYITQHYRGWCMYLWTCCAVYVYFNAIPLYKLLLIMNYCNR